MAWTSEGVVKKKRAWAVQACSDSGERRELAYPSEAQARFVAAVLALGPARLPERPKARIARRLAALPAEGGPG